MNDLNKIVPCPKCGAGTPLDGKECINCGAVLIEALAEVMLAKIRERSQQETVIQQSEGTLDNKPVNELTLDDFKRYPVWEFDLANEGLPGHDESWVVPVKKLPVTDLSNCVVGIEARLACGTPIFCILDMIYLNDLQKSQQLIGITLIRENGTEFSLVKKPAFDYEERSQYALSRFLGLTIDEIFPISYDISHLAIGLDSVVKGQISKEQPE